MTTKFRDALSSGQFPRVLTNNWSSGNLQFAESSWQFSLVLPWLKNFIVTYHDRTLCILDPTTSTVAGVLCLNHAITSIATNGKFVYVLCDGIARPLARFTAHTSYLKSIQKIKSNTTKNEDETASNGLSELTEENEHVEGDDKNIFINGSDEKEDEGEREIVQERSTSEEMDSPFSSTPADELSPLLQSPLDPKEDASTEDREHEMDILHGISKVDNHSTPDVDNSATTTTNTSACTVATDTPMSELETTIEESHTVTDNEMMNTTNDIKTEGVEMENQSELISTTTISAEIFSNIADGINSNSLMEDHTEMNTTPSISNDSESSSNNTKTTESHSAHYTPTHGDPPSVTGPLAMQDLAREVTDLLRPALGKLSTFMRSQDRKKTGNNSGTATPQETPLTNHSEEERHAKLQEEGHKDEVAGTQPVETQATPSPKLKLKLGGKIGELISGDKDKVYVQQKCFIGRKFWLNC